MAHQPHPDVRHSEHVEPVQNAEAHVARASSAARAGHIAMGRFWRPRKILPKMWLAAVLASMGLATLALEVCRAAYDASCIEPPLFEKLRYLRPLRGSSKAHQWLTQAGNHCISHQWRILNPSKVLRMPGEVPGGYVDPWLENAIIPPRRCRLHPQPPH